MKMMWRVGVNLRKKEKDKLFWKGNFLEILYPRGKVGNGYDAPLCFASQEVKLTIYFSIIGAFWKSISKYTFHIILPSFFFFLSDSSLMHFFSSSHFFLIFIFYLRSIFWHVFSLQDYEFLERSPHISFTFLFPYLASSPSTVLFLI